MIPKLADSGLDGIKEFLTGGKGVRNPYSGLAYIYGRARENGCRRICVSCVKPGQCADGHIETPGKQLIIITYLSERTDR